MKLQRVIIQSLKLTDWSGLSYLLLYLMNPELQLSLVASKARAFQDMQTGMKVLEIPNPQVTGNLWDLQCMHKIGRV